MTAAATTIASTPLVAPDYTAALVELKNEISLLKTSVKPPNTTPVTVDYAAELVALKQDLQSLRTFITTAVEQLTTDIASLHVTHVAESFEVTPPAPTREMEIDDGHSTEPTPETHELIAELRHDIATIAHEMRLIVDLKSDLALIKSHPLFCNLKPINQHPVT